MENISVTKKITTWEKISVFKKILLLIFIVLVQILVTFMIYNLGGIKTPFAYFVFLTVMFGGFFLGPQIGIFLGATGGFLLGPFMPSDTIHNIMQKNFDWEFRIFFYMFSGYISGEIVKYLMNIIKNLSSKTLYNHITHLPNKNYFENMDIKYDPSDILAVIKCEDYYKVIENFGDDYARELKEKISSVLISAFNRENNDTNVFHLEDDEFAVISSELKIENKFREVIKNMYKAINSNELKYFPTFFIGVSRCKGSNIKILQNAETARRSAKSKIKLYDIYSSDLSEESNRDFELSLEIRRALKKREFFLCYHPKINLRSGEVEGVEALIRWNHPEKGLIPPDRFIPSIEKGYIINKITKWVLKTSFLEIKKMGKENIDINVSVNIPLKILQNSLILKYLEGYKREQIPIEKLELEILERDGIEEFKNTANTMKNLKDMGIKFSLDDYGTGYSTLSYMKNLPFDKIKIDSGLTP
jgi:EAL domain-containing protein (putative c-di-GMP-specific phosphodiesterase class I)/GGDEF domain-containing protein